MARSCAICGKVSMGGFNPQSSGMNRVRAHRRYQPNLQPFTIRENGTDDEGARLHALPAHVAEVREVAALAHVRTGRDQRPVLRLRRRRPVLANETLRSAGFRRLARWASTTTRVASRGAGVHADGRRRPSAVAVSSQIVNGPSLTSSTAITSPNRPVATSTPSSRSAAANRR